MIISTFLGSQKKLTGVGIVVWPITSASPSAFLSVYVHVYIYLKSSNVLVCYCYIVDDLPPKCLVLGTKICITSSHVISSIVILKLFKVCVFFLSLISDLANIHYVHLHYIYTSKIKSDDLNCRYAVLFSFLRFLFFFFTVSLYSTQISNGVDLKTNRLPTDQPTNQPKDKSSWKA